MAKDLEHYLENPDEAPFDEELLSQLLEGGAIDATAGAPAAEETDVEDEEALAAAAAEAGEAEAAKTPADPAKPAAEAGADTPADSSTAKADDEPYVETRDGKHRIPYSVLEQERREKRELTDRLQQLESTNQDLMARIQQAASQPGQDAAAAPTSVASPGSGFDLEQFRELYGDELADALKAQMDTVNELRGQVQTFQQREAERDQQRQREEQEEAERARDDVLAAVEANPTLKHWRDSDPAMWAAAVAVDQQLRQDAKFASLSYADRFNEVVKRLGGATPAPSQDDIRKQAEEKLRTASAPQPRSISDLAGGSPPEQSERQRAENMSPVELEAMFARMSPEDQEAYLASL